MKVIYLHFKDCILFNWVVLFISNDLNYVDLYDRVRIKALTLLNQKRRKYFLLKFSIFLINYNEKQDQKSTTQFYRIHPNKHCEGSCELLSLNLILMLTSCWWIAKFLQALCNQHQLWTITVPTLCKMCAYTDTHRQKYCLLHF